MKKRIFNSIMCFFLVAGCTATLLNAQGMDSPQMNKRLSLQIGRIVRGMEGTVGVAAKHLETGDCISVNGEEFFPMASVFKLPILVAVHLCTPFRCLRLIQKQLSCLYCSKVPLLKR